MNKQKTSLTSRGKKSNSQTISIHARIEVEAEIVGELGIHALLLNDGTWDKSCYSLTHVLSGRRIGTSSTKTKARQFAKEVLANGISLDTLYRAHQAHVEVDNSPLKTLHLLAAEIGIALNP